MKIVIANGEWRRLSKVTGLELTLTRRDATRTELLTAAIHSILNGSISVIPT